MIEAVAFFPKTSLQHSRACLGICRHCLESTTSAQPCHAALPDTIVALEIAVALLEAKSDLAYDRLCYCAEVCAAGVEKCRSSSHPRCQQSAEACRTFVSFWRSGRYIEC
jgi:hypothetical protein